VDKKDLKTILAGLSIAGLIAGCNAAGPDGAGSG